MTKTTSKTSSVSPGNSHPSPSAEPARTATARPGASDEEIARRAYEIFLARGGEHGRHEEDWAQAERELRLGRQ